MHIYCNMDQDVLDAFANCGRESNYAVRYTYKFISMSIKTGKWFSLNSGFSDSIFIADKTIFIYIIELQSMGVLVTVELVHQLMEKQL